MLFSVIVPSYLGNYPSAAKDRHIKIYRAMDSVLSQTFKDFEVIFVADGCEESYLRITERYPTVNTYLIPKQKTMSGMVRNFGIKKAKGDYITYCDIDDFWGAEHLQKIADGIDKAGRPDWTFFNDYIARKKGEPIERHCSPLRMYHCGTSNIAHKKELNVWWGDGYLHDFNFIKELRRFKFATITTPEYVVMHIPNQIDL